MLRPSCKAVGITRSLTHSGFLDVTQRCFGETLRDIYKTLYVFSESEEVTKYSYSSKRYSLSQYQMIKIKSS